MIFESVASFRDQLPDGGVLIGLDIGTKTIGIAFCDAGWTFASPADLIKRAKFTKDKFELKAAIATRPGVKARAASPAVPLQKISPIWAFRFCCATNAGLPKPSNAT
jgi:hypothetical protein